MAASQAFAADTLTPTPVNVTLPAGGSTTVAKELHLDGLPAKADIIVAIDTTGSMGAALAQAKLDAVDICTDVQAAIPGARFAAVEFQDYPFSPYGIATDDPYELHTTYTADCAAFSAAVGLMALGNGLDNPESNNRVHYEAYSDPALLLVRDPDATRFLVVLADNVPHSIPAFGDCPSTAPFSDPGPDGIDDSGGGDDIDTPEAIDGLIADDHILLYISYNSGTVALPCHEDLAAPTGGDAVPDDQAQDIAVFIIAQAQETPYTVDLEVSAGCQIGFDFGGAFPTGTLTGEQTINFTETITAPELVGNYTCTLTAVMTPGGPTTAVETVNVTVVVPANNEACKVTYGGRITAANGDKATFGGNAKGVGPAGEEEYQDHGPLTAMNVHSIDVLSVTCSPDGTSASIFGTATIDGAGSFDYRIDLTDPAAPGLPDTYRIRLSNGYDSGVQNLSGGNVQIH